MRRRCRGDTTSCDHSSAFAIGTLPKSYLGRASRSSRDALTPEAEAVSLTRPKRGQLHMSDQSKLSCSPPHSVTVLVWPTVRMTQLVIGMPSHALPIPCSCVGLMQRCMLCLQAHADKQSVTWPFNGCVWYVMSHRLPSCLHHVKIHNPMG
jgi:hypothetical protein